MYLKIYIFKSIIKKLKIKNNKRNYYLIIILYLTFNI